MLSTSHTFTVNFIHTTMKTDRLFADYQLAQMEHNALNTEASKEKLELAKLAYDNALAKEQEALAPVKVEAPVKIEAPVENVEPPVIVLSVPSIIPQLAGEALEVETTTPVPSEAPEKKTV